MGNKKKTNCGDCKYQMSGFDGGFFGLPVTCECRIFGETENRKSCSRFEKRMSRGDLFERIRLLEKENEKLKQDQRVIGETLDSIILERDTLSKENEQLKSIKEFAEKKGITISLIDEAFRRCWNDNGKLVEENEQLKEENIRLKKLREYCAEWIGVDEENLYDVVR